MREIPGRLHVARAATGSNDDFLREAWSTTGCEGLMFKRLDAPYEPGRRSPHWLKFKPEYVSGLSDSLDLVVIGAWKGLGKRSGGLGSFLLAARDTPAASGTLGNFVTVCKVGTGLNEAELATMSDRVQRLSIAERRAEYVVHPSLSPDVWCDPALVWEIVGSELTESTVHGGHCGLGLRFPRFIRDRPDKIVDDITSTADLLAIRQSQQPREPVL